MRQMGHGTGEPNRAKPPDKGRFVPVGERARIKIAAHGQSLCARAAHLLAESGYFYSARFSRSNDFGPK